jgi:flagellin-like protein
LVKVRKDKNNIYAKLLKDKKGISPVITTVILVAVGIALAVAIGLWMSGLVATFTRFEKLEVTSAYAISTTNGWTVKIVAKNTGSADATVSTVMINGIPASSSGSSQYGWTSNSYISKVQDNSTSAGTDLTSSLSSGGVPIPVGSTVTFTITLKSSDKIGSTTLTSGITLNIVLHSAAGKDYPASVTLP